MGKSERKKNVFPLRGVRIFSLILLNNFIYLFGIYLYIFLNFLSHTYIM